MGNDFLKDVEMACVNLQKEADLLSKNYKLTNDNECTEIDSGLTPYGDFYQCLNSARWVIESIIKRYKILNKIQ